MIKAALHVHSTYSDGEFTLPELRSKFAASGCGVICVTDHADAFDETSLAEYVSECESLSNETILLVPGLEYSCVRRMHIIGYGTTSLVASDDPETVISHIRAQGGVAVIAHPPDALFEMIENFATLPDGIEGWNSKYDGRYAPRPSTFALITRLQLQRPSLKAFYGQDLHWRRQFAGLYSLLEISTLSRMAVLTALSEGQFAGARGSLVLPSNGRIEAALMKQFERANNRSMQFRHYVKSVQRLLGKSAKRTPRWVKAQFRRFF